MWKIIRGGQAEPPSSFPAPLFSFPCHPPKGASQAIRMASVSVWLWGKTWSSDGGDNVHDQASISPDFL